MNKALLKRLLWISAAVLIVAGAIMTIRNFGSVEDASMRIKKRISELKILRNMEADLARYEAAKQKVEQISEKHAVALAGVLQEVLPGNKADDMRDSRKDLIPGWSIRQKEISISDVPIGKMMEFVRKAESQTIPWCMTKCVIRAAPHAAGVGQVVLTMEAVEKAE
jgi:hypothetical protein